MRLSILWRTMEIEEGVIRHFFVFTTKPTQPRPQVFSVKGALTCLLLLWHFLIGFMLACMLETVMVNAVTQDPKTNLNNFKKRNLHGLAPAYLLNEFSRSRDFHSYNTRHRDLLRLPLARTTKGTRTPPWVYLFGHSCYRQNEREATNFGVEVINSKAQV